MRLVDWDYLKSLLEDKLDIPGEILDYIAVKDILQLCASGSSNVNIAKFTNIELEYVSTTIKEFFYFPGWQDDLDFNPYLLYKSCGGVYNDFCKEVTLSYPYYTESKIDQIYLTVDVFIGIENKMEKYWL